MKKFFNDIWLGVKEGIIWSCCILVAFSIVMLIIQGVLFWIDPNPYNKVERVATLLGMIFLGGPTLVALSVSLKWVCDHF